MSQLSSENGKLGKLIRSVLQRVLLIIRDLMYVRTERKGIVVHDQVPAIDFNTLHRHHAVDAFG